MTDAQIKAKAKEYFPNDEFKQQAVIDTINWATKELQKENAELKEKLLEQKQYTEFKCNEFVKKKEVYEKEHYQLTKTKELLELFVQWNYGCCKEPDYKNLVKQAEQFLKDI